MAVIRFWHFGWKMPIRAYFWRFLGILTPKIVTLTPKGMQLPINTRLIYNLSKLVQRFDPQVR